jgi:hypothetical protein
MGCDIHLYAEYKISLPSTSLKQACKRAIVEMRDNNLISETELEVLPEELQSYINQIDNDYRWEFIYAEEYKIHKEKEGP